MGPFLEKVTSASFYLSYGLSSCDASSFHHAPRDAKSYASFS
jgi:hypothetical protein